MELYVKALIREMELQCKQTEKHPIETIFLGGGTPTTLPVKFLKSILENATKFFKVESKAEITLEANPTTIKENYLKDLRSAGYNRISVGAQSFLTPELALLERIHGVSEIALTIQNAREAGFENLSIDLMFALPGQSSKHWAFSLEQALALKPDHISAYNLTIEPETRFFRYRETGRLNLPDEEQQLDLIKQTIKTFTEAGYEHYEISNFAKSGKRCRHNLNYWKNGEYFGFGAGASSFLDGSRFKNENKPDKYIQSILNDGSAVAFSERPDIATAMGETLMLGLRLREGLSIDTFEQRFGVVFEQIYSSVVPSLLMQKLVDLKSGRLALTEKGFHLADSVILEFFPQSPAHSNSIK